MARAICHSRGRLSSRWLERFFRNKDIAERLWNKQFEELAVAIVILIVVGGILGWLASILMRIHAQQGLALNVAVGIVGAFLAGFLLNPLFGGGNILAGGYSAGSVLVSFLGAIGLLAIVNYLRRGAMR
jgi:uncharacterized membrane protein YeaQ/YmgE (transglycosylase-associated protein family)